MSLKYKLGNDTRELLAVVGFLAEALQFYGTAVNVRPDGSSCMLFNALDLDCGTRAREALELLNDYLMSCGLDTKVLLKLPYAPYLSEIDQNILQEMHAKQNVVHFFTNVSGNSSLVGTMFSNRIVRQLDGATPLWQHSDHIESDTAKMSQEEVLKQFNGKKLIFHVGVAQGMDDLAEDVKWIMQHMKPASLQLNVTSA